MHFSAFSASSSGTKGTESPPPPPRDRLFLRVRDEAPFFLTEPSSQPSVSRLLREIQKYSCPSFFALCSRFVYIIFLLFRVSLVSEARSHVADFTFYKHDALKAFGRGEIFSVARDASHDRAAISTCLFVSYALTTHC